MLDRFTLPAEEWPNAIRMRGKNSWLNNDHPLENGISYSGKTFTTVEAAFKFAKYQQFPHENRVFLSQCADPRTAQDIRDIEHQLRSSLKISEHWQEIRYGIMLIFNREKYRLHDELAQRLKDTHPHPIIEVTRPVDPSGKPWNDRYWGVCLGEDNDLTKADGCNAMGRIAMQIRNELLAIS